MKLFSINKNQAAVIATLMILCFLGAGYFFIYLPQNEKRIQEQRFNALQNIDLNIHAKIENSFALLNTMLTGYDVSLQDSVRLNQYLKNYSTANFILSPPQVINRPKPGTAADTVNLDSVYSIRVNNDNREISLLFSKLKTNKENDTVAYSMGMKFSFEQFLHFLLKKDLFDEYIIFSKGKPIYESFPAGISYVKEDSLLGAKNGIGSSGIRSQLISGTEYKMFLQPVGFDANNEWIIGGLLSSSHYQAEKTQLSTQVILLLATIMLIGMLAFPWLKLYQMGSKDRLTISDGIASIFISMLLMSLLFFVFFNYNHPFRPPVKDPKANLANAINTAFKGEVDLVYHKLQQFDNAVSFPARDIVINIKKDSVAYSADGNAVLNAAAIKEAFHGIDFNQVYWLNKKGEEVINWNAENNMNAPHGNFKNREYFKRIGERRGYLLNGDSNKRYFLEQGISWTTGAFRSVLSMKSKLSSSDSPYVAALAFNFKSLSKVVLPAGYLFAITDNGGNVLYHSESSRNRNENLLNVFSKSNELKSCLDAGAPGKFSTKYYGNDYEAEVKPVNGLPYFIVLLEDAVYNETLNMEIYSFTFSMLLLFFGFLVIQLFAIFLVSAKRSFFKKQLLDTSWIGPKMSNHKEYILSTVFHCILLFLLVFFFSHSSFLEYIFILLCAVTLIPLYLNVIFAKRYSEKKSNTLQFKTLAQYCLWGFMTVIGITAFKLLDFANFIQLCCFVLIVVLLAGALYITRQQVYRLASKIKNSGRCTVLFGKWNYVDSFALMAFTRLMITSGLPAVFFFIGSYNYEQNLGIRYKQADFAGQLINKFPGVAPDDLLALNNKGNGVYYDGSIIGSVSVISRQNALGDGGAQYYTPEEDRTIGLLKLFRLPITDKAVVENRFYNPMAVDSSFFFNHLLQEVFEKNKGTVTYRQSSLQGKDIRLASDNLNYHYPSVFSGNGFNGALFWLIAAAMLFIFYFVLKSIIKKLFALNLPNLEIWNRLDNEILVKKDWHQPLFVIGLPGAGKKKYLLDKIAAGEITMDDETPLYFNNPDEKKNNVFIAELINIPSTGNEQEEKAIWTEYSKKVFDEKNRVIIVNHFEYNIQDSLSNRFKLEFLERLYLENKCKIIILSTIHPVAFLDSAMEQPVKEEEKASPGQDLERWHVLLGHYRIIVLPLQLPSAEDTVGILEGNIVGKESGEGIPGAGIVIGSAAVKTFSRQDGLFLLPDLAMPFTIIVSSEGYETATLTVSDKKDLVDISMVKGPSYISSQLIRMETNHTYFLKKLQGPAFEAGRAVSETERIAKFDELAFKFQVSSHYFYMYIWQSLTKEEKFLLYDLAEDNLVNSFDDYNLSMLIAKGVVTRPDGTLKLFNKGFRNFILTAIGNSEAIKIKNQIKENGNWNTLKNPLQLVILAILAFLLTSQEEAFAKLITYVAALGAAVPAVLKLFSFFDKSPRKPG